MLVATPAIVSLNYAEATSALKSVLEMVEELSKYVASAAKSELPGLQQGWAAEVSFGVLQVAPLVALLSGAWKKLGQPSKSAKNKMSAEAKTALAEMLSQIGATAEAATRFVETVRVAAKERLHVSDEAVVAAVVAAAGDEAVSKENLGKIAARLNASWKAFFGTIAGGTSNKK